MCYKAISSKARSFMVKKCYCLKSQRCQKQEHEGHKGYTMVTMGCLLSSCPLCNLCVLVLLSNSNTSPEWTAG
jgi:hypothetical protein